MQIYKAILFDLRGTLAEISDSEDLVSNTKKILGYDKYAKLRKHFVGWHINNKTEQEFIDSLNKEISLNKNDIQVIKEFIAPKYYKKFPETDEVLKSLQKEDLKVILVTNSPPSSKKAFYNMNLTSLFDRTVFSCDVGVLKPNKEIFQVALKGFDLNTNEALMIGDSLEKDVQGAINSGLNGLLIDRKGLSVYNNKISNLREILDRTKK